MITSKDILEKTGISRATLNNYIKMGILPKPDVRRAGSDLKGTKQIGYFSEDVLDRIEKVNRLKSEGGSMEEIARTFRESSHVVDLPSRRQDVNIELEQADRRDAGDADDAITKTKDEEESLTLTVTDIQSPAMLVNHNFEIEWINRECEEQIFNMTVSRINDIASRNLFKLFFSWEFHSQLENVEDVIAFHLPFIKPRFSKDRINELYQGISEAEISFIERLYDDESQLPVESINNSPLNLVKKGNKAVFYRVHSMRFREGTFFVYLPADEMTNDVMEFLSQRGKIINELLKHRMPSLVSLCVLVADLQDSLKISAELLPAEYFYLINQLWKTLQSSFDKYNAIHGQHAGDGVLYYFIKKPGSNYVMDAINCALELKEKMKQFNSEWKLRKGWLNDLYINIGINEGQEFFGTIHSSSSVEFTALGDSINYAGRLSDFARYGSIWATKNVIGKLDAEDIDRTTFGIHRTEQDRELFIDNSFARVVDLLDMEDKTSSKFLDIATVPITEILAIE